LPTSNDMNQEHHAVLDSMGNYCCDGGLVVAHVCDCHLLQSKPIDKDDLKHAEDLAACPDPGVMPNRLAMVITELNELRPRPSCVLFGGDMTERARPQEWDQFFQIVQTLEIPYFLTLGNHDHDETSTNWPRTRRVICRGLQRFDAGRTPPDSVAESGLYYAVQLGTWRLLVVDSLFDVPLDRIQRDWLTQELAGNCVPTILSIHRPFVEVGNFMDRYRMRDPELLRLIAGSECVKVVLSGHTHKARSCMYSNMTHLVSPSIYEGIDDTPGYRLVCLRDGGFAFTAIRRLNRSPAAVRVDYQIDPIEPYDGDLFCDSQ